ncbi:hypothetical protein EKH57_00450 (plasmid) [Halorubrum sp. BOL3-1]|uniref:hypothetical protein n=1 Tax=Halorubrum sp. BOL3-1 TaxID=2497325 RepID=UPI001004E28A|nr:hypothetical protein [Halorubrum sp. BOL3-1]QAU11383.1 hypothetical protein EKH57_00450 [Halorubrum sp. BOL3-1]
MLLVDIDDGRLFRRRNIEFGSAALDLFRCRPLGLGEQLGEPSSEIVSMSAGVLCPISSSSRREVIFVGVGTS